MCIAVKTEGACPTGSARSGDQIAVYQIRVGIQNVESASNIK